MTLARKRDVLQELVGNPLWQVHVENRFWVCPCCGQIGSCWKKPREMLAEVLDHIQIRCSRSRDRNGRILSMNGLRHRTRHLQIRKHLRQDPAWKILDRKGHWFCPHCALPTGIRFREGRSVPESILAEIDHHVRPCSVSGQNAEWSVEDVCISRDLWDTPEWGFFTGTGRWICPFCVHATPARIGKGKVFTSGLRLSVREHLQKCPGGRVPHSTAHLQKAVKRADAIVALSGKIRRQLHSRSVWTCLDGEGSWICPYCQKSVYHIRFNTEFALRESVPEMMAVHLVRNCRSFESGATRIRRRGDIPGKALTTRRVRNTSDPGNGRETTRIIRVIQEEIAGLRSEVESGREVATSLEEARKMQLKMLPPVPRIPGCSFATLYRPCQKVGGDFYDFIPLSDARLGIAIGDVSGHGMEAALVMGMAKKALQIHARQRDNPVEILSAANEDIRDDLHANSFLTVTLCIFYLANESFQFSRACHTPLVLINSARMDPVQVLQPNGTALGMFKTDRFARMLESSTIDLREGDLLVQFTDGVTETMNERNEEFGMDRLVEILMESAEKDVEYISYRIEKALDLFRGKVEQQDDIALLAFRYRG